MRYPTTQFILNSKSRRRGQALLLSVLIMIFIVLLGTTFIAIVASNMSNTARTGAKDEARQAAQSGIEFVDAQLTGSNSGLDWRPLYPTPAGAFYYSSLDRAQGWSQAFFKLNNTSTIDDAHFVKYPNPQSAPSSAESAANFMIRVSQVQDGEPDNVGNTKSGDIRIESIGFAQDDPAAYYKVVAYKKGLASNPLTAAMRSVTNWDFNDNTVPQGYVQVTGPGTVSLGSTFSLSNAKGYFDNADCPFYVTITTAGDANNTAAPQVVGAQVTSVSYTTGEPQLTVAGTVSVTISGTNGTLLVQKAAALGAPATISFDNATAMNDPAATQVNYRASTPNNPFQPSDPNYNNQPGSVWVNGGLVWFGNTLADNLIAPSAATATAPASYIQVSGLFAPASATPGIASVTGTGVATPTQIPVSSADITYATNPAVTNGLLDDGWNRIGGMSGNTRQVQDFTPPDITAGGNGLGRYRQLTRYSSGINPDTGVPYYTGGTDISSVYGYGAGIYINNPSDVEKRGTKLMKQNELEELWYGTDGHDYEREHEPADPTSTSKSLEEQHMRGWVSPDQFLPRGAEVIINNDDTITVNLDPLDDNSTNYLHANFANSSPTPNPRKGWRNLDGSLAGDANNGGVYSQTFNWPANGTLFAEGNIRIRGVNLDAPSSLTVVSMNNIYVDGSLKLSHAAPDKPKVLLLAKKNVIANPTLALAPVQAVTTLSADANASATTIDVYDTANFKIGDYITFAGSNTPVCKIAGKNSSSLTLDPALPASTPASRQEGKVVFTLFDPRTDSGYYNSGDQQKPYNTAIRLTRESSTIQRRVQWPSDATNIRLAFRHSAEYRKALEVAVDNTPVPANPGDPAGPVLETSPPTTLTNKVNLEATSSQDIIETANKTLNVTYHQNPPTATPPGEDEFLGTPPADQPTAASTTLDDLVAEIKAKHPETQWHYDNAETKVNDNYAGTSDQLPYYFLASAGSRYNSNTARPGTWALPSGEPLFPQPSSGVMNFPMATSVRVMMNSVQTSFSRWIFANQVINPLGLVNQFGFSPVFVDDDPQKANEDILTVDQYFYQPHEKSAPDSAYPDYFPGIEDSRTGTYDATYTGQNKYDTDAEYTLDSRTLAEAPNEGSNEIVLQQNDADVDGTNTVQNYFTNRNSPTETGKYPMPFYRLSNLKLQNEGFDSSATPNLEQIGTGATLDINAFVYAQEGGWNVIPGGKFDEKVKNGNAPINDLNRDGVISQGESAAAYRYNRYNYQIVFTGAIMENQTASIDNVSDWMNKWATVKLNSGDFAGGAVQAPGTTGTRLFYNSADPANNDFNTILYYFDPSAAAGALSTDTGFHEPVAPGLIYQG